MESRDLGNLGDGELTSDEIEERIRILNQKIPKEPKNYELLKERASLYIELNKADLALSDVNECVKHLPNDAEVYFLQHEIHNLNMDYREAIISLDSAIALNPDEAKYYHFRGFTYHLLKKFDSALASYDKAISLQPLPFTFLKRGDVYLDLREFDQAISECKTALEIIEELYKSSGLTQAERPYPLLHLYYLTLGSAYKGRDDYAQALKCFNQVITLRPDLPVGYYNRGMLYKDFTTGYHYRPPQKGFDKLEAALEDFTFVIEREPENPEYYFQRADCKLTQQDYVGAIADCSIAINLGKDHPNRFLYHFARGNAYFYSRDFENAIIDFSNTIWLNPGDAQAHLNRGNCFRELNQLDQALADYSDALKIDPSYENALNNRANLYLALNDLPSAIADFEKLDSLMVQKDPAVYFNLALGYLKVGDLVKANDYLEPLVQRFPNDPRILFNYAKLLALQKEKKEAQRILKKVIEINPEYKKYAQKDEILARHL